MFVRFRQVGRRLKVSLAETRRTEGKVRHEHIAGLGSVVIPSDVPERIAFWRKLHERLARLANRIDSETQGKILGQVHGRIPMPTVDEMRALQIENAKADARLWSELQSRHDELVAGQIGLRDAAEKKITENRAASENAKRHAAIARERLKKLSRGEAVAGDLGRPVSLRDQLKAAGFSEADLRAAEEWHQVCNLICGDDEAAIDEFIHAWVRDRIAAHERSDRAHQRKVLKRVRYRIEVLSRLDEATRKLVLERLAE
jgi:hypothetical protein